LVKVDHPERGEYISVGCPIKLSASAVEVERSPLLGEHTEEILRDVLKYSDEEIQTISASGAVGDVKKAAE
jgi:formyl-CoA transferase